MKLVSVFTGKVYLQLVALLMLLLFAGTPVFQLLHSHQDDTVCCTHADQTIAEYHPKCEVCKHLAYHHPSFTVTVSSLLLLHADRQMGVINTFFDNTLVLLPGVSWSNKGPPAVIA